MRGAQAAGGRLLTRHMEGAPRKVAFILPASVCSVPSALLGVWALAGGEGEVLAHQQFVFMEEVRQLK